MKQKKIMANKDAEQNEKMGVLHFDVPKRQKAAWVRAAQRADSKLIPWIVARLDEAAQATETEGRDG